MKPLKSYADSFFDWVECQAVDNFIGEEVLLLSMKISVILYWIVRILAALIMAQTLYFKFTGASESVFIFTAVGMEPWGRIGVGVLELLASILLLINVTAWLGASLALGLMLGAIGMHLTILGIEVEGDGGYLFALSVIVSVCSAFVLIQNKQKILNFLSFIFNRK